MDKEEIVDGKKIKLTKKLKGYLAFLHIFGYTNFKSAIFLLYKAFFFYYNKHTIYIYYRFKISKYKNNIEKFSTQIYYPLRSE